MGIKTYQIQRNEKLANIEIEYTTTTTTTTDNDDNEEEDINRLKLDHKPDLKLVASAPRRKKQKKVKKKRKKRINQVRNKFSKYTFMFSKELIIILC